MYFNIEINVLNNTVLNVKKCICWCLSISEILLTSNAYCKRMFIFKNFSTVMTDDGSLNWNIYHLMTNIKVLCLTVVPHLYWI